MSVCYFLCKIFFVLGSVREILARSLERPPSHPFLSRFAQVKTVNTRTTTMADM